MKDVRLLLLGSGTSQGVPTIGCTCDTCTSKDSRDTRLRPSALFQVDGINIIIDTSSDFRQQMLKYNITSLACVLFTHHHFDHIGGFDDIRSYNFIHRKPVRVYGMKRTLEELKTTFRYAFAEPEQLGGGIPQVELSELPDIANIVDIDGIHVQTIPVFHGNLPVFGFRIGNVAYITDTNRIPEESLQYLQGLDILVLDALRFKPHPTHYHLEQSIIMAEQIGAKRTYFTHIAHNIKHERDSIHLPDGMEFGYDGLMVSSNGSAQ